MTFNQDGAEAIKNRNLWMLSGKHRWLALRKYVESLNSELADAKKAVKDIIQEKTDEQIANLAEGAAGKLKANKDLVKVLESKIDKARCWTVRVYDRGASCER